MTTGVDQSLVYHVALKNAGVPMEMHLYAQGGHAFGLRRTVCDNGMVSAGRELATNDSRYLGIGAARKSGSSREGAMPVRECVLQFPCRSLTEA
jgi:hypothetical protein